MPPSERFIRLYDSLPGDARRNLVEKHLVPLLNAVPLDRSRKAIAAASRMHKRYEGIPILNLKQKRKEVNALLDELEKDMKRSFVKGRSIRDELLSEIVDSLTDWLNDIWSIIYEYKVDFEEAHRCLVYAASVLEDLSSSRGLPSEGCKCAWNNLYVSLKIKKRNGRVVKSFSLSGGPSLDRALLWIWRDMFLVMLASGNTRLTSQLPEMLADMEHVMKWRALERMLCGGRMRVSWGDEEDEEEDEEDNWMREYEEDDHEDDPDRCSCSYHADHWPKKLNDHIVPLRKLVQDHLLSVFQVSPSLGLWECLLAISTDPKATRAQLEKQLSSIATSSTSTFVAALDIRSFQCNNEALISLLDTHAHLLRPRDAPSYQQAVISLSHNPFFQYRALQMLEKELLDAARAIRAALLGYFSEIDKQANKDEFEDIMKLRAASDARRERLEAWVDAIVTPGTQPPHPMAFAALMMGLPLGAAIADSDEPDPLGYLDIDQSDPDLEDLREEFRPQLKLRFESWVLAAGSVKGGSTVLSRVYKDILGSMPYVRARDAVDEMIGRLADRPSKHHICDGVDALARFAKTQKKKMATKADKQKRKAEKSAPPAVPPGPSTPPTPPTPSQSSPPALAPSFNGLDDVD
ncbi:hypothetical protein GLOTRDRAFT_136589 [Gloeophyllum trabeum ATCC 11539]|uniref:Uncharacterized protein n=1 Tax=Gloeophyllum trabeum (strain ATCC 11539 / FP-39264 / Madison 617) TaxID=670483 RepID=S7RY12_GLOTA|nr:uncharacterized protein GLOTRDRAFT_136589 [Gloeophyllum trabeum ATCC 11539]EPQ59835.1 hypothetical protein GLOTRDRAFT_136589 [Gloeophyllum trabeum ATCC 11539]